MISVSFEALNSTLDGLEVEALVFKLLWHFCGPLAPGL